MSTERQAILSVRDLKMHFQIRDEKAWPWTPMRALKAVDGISFDLYAGETLGVVGESGCGKSTLARAILNLHPATAGSIVWMGQEMAQWVYPYHFIDFETSGVALPFFAGMRPYEQIAFQFSHHVMHADGRVEHAGEFLMTEPVAFPNFEFARALKAQLENDQGTVFMWSHHENTILTKIVDQIAKAANRPPDGAELSEFMQSLVKRGNRAMYDLCTLSKEAYFHVSTKGSSSIKKVLPAVMATSPRLRKEYGQATYGAPSGIPSKNYSGYAWWQDDGKGKPKDPYSLLKSYGEDLLGETLLPSEDPDDLVVAEGGAATTAYARLQFETLNPATRAKINEALLRYCELDTLAMVMIVQGWRDLLEMPR